MCHRFTWPHSHKCRNTVSLKLLAVCFVLVSVVNYVVSFLSLSENPQWKTDIIKSKPQISMVTAVPACIVSEPTHQAADSGTKTLSWKKNFTDSEAKDRDSLYRRAAGTLQQKTKIWTKKKNFPLQNKFSMKRITLLEIKCITSRFWLALSV